MPVIQLKENSHLKNHWKTTGLPLESGHTSELLLLPQRECVYLLSIRLVVKVNSVADVLRSLSLLTVSLKPPFALNKHMENTKTTKPSISTAAITAAVQFGLEEGVLLGRQPSSYWVLIPNTGQSCGLSSQTLIHFYFA